MSDAYARLLFAAPAGLGALLLAIAVLLREGFSLIGDKALLVAVFAPVHFSGLAAAAPLSSTGGAGAVHDDGEWQPYSAARVAQIKASGAPLLVNFTASWCLTCLVNERNAFADSAVQKIFQERKVTLMKGDWTNRDPAITHALSEFGRAGVPLYVVYNAKPGNADPVVLPQILTASVVESAFGQ